MNVSNVVAGVVGGYVGYRASESIAYCVNNNIDRVLIRSFSTVIFGVASSLMVDYVCNLANN